MLTSVYWKPRGRPYQYADLVQRSSYAAAHRVDERIYAVRCLIETLQEYLFRLEQDHWG